MLMKPRPSWCLAFKHILTPHPGAANIFKGLVSLKRELHGHQHLY